MFGLSEKEKCLFICTLFNNALSISNDMTSKHSTGKDVDKSSRGLTEVLSQHLSAGIEESNGKPDRRRPCRDPNQAPPEYKSGASPLESARSVESSAPFIFRYVKIIIKLYN
jgi:hypothetical protein